MTELQEGRWHIPIVRDAVRAKGGTYIEIGVRFGDCFNEAAPHAREAHAVDPTRYPHLWPGTFWEMSSDEFFAEFEGGADVVFIDGDHEYEQARRDFENALRILHDGGTIFLHDTWPAALDDPNTGTVWRLAREIEREEKFSVSTYRRYPGLTCVS